LKVFAARPQVAEPERRSRVSICLPAQLLFQFGSSERSVNRVFECLKRRGVGVTDAQCGGKQVSDFNLALKPLREQKQDAAQRKQPPGRSLESEENAQAGKWEGHGDAQVGLGLKTVQLPRQLRSAPSRRVRIRGNSASII